MTPAHRTRWDELVAHLQQPPTVPASVPPTHFRMLKQHAAKLRDSGAITAATDADLERPFHVVNFFTVVESKPSPARDADGRPTQSVSPTANLTIEQAAALGADLVLSWRQRPIFWPRRFNRDSEYKSAMTLQSAHLARRLLADAEVLAAFDVSASYWHLPTFGRFVVYDEDGSAYIVNRLLYGIDAAAEMMQIAMESIAEAACRKSGAHCVVHIDNILFAGSRAQVSAACQAFKSICTTCNITLNTEDANTPATVVPFIGLVFDAEHKTLWLGPQFMKKLQESIHKPDAFTWQHLDELAGRVIYALYSTARPLWRAGFFFKWYRRQLAANAQRSDDQPFQISMPPSIQRQFDALIDMLHLNEPTPVTSNKRFGAVGDEEFDCVLLTDASETGCGCVLFRPGLPPLVFGRNWHDLGLHPGHITIAEAYAAAIGLNRWHDETEGCRVLLLIDNTSAAFALRGFAKDNTLRAVADMAAQTASAAHVAVAYVPTALNVADAPSRDIPIDESVVIKCADFVDQLSLTAGSYLRRGGGIRGGGGVFPAGIHARACNNSRHPSMRPA